MKQTTILLVEDNPAERKLFLEVLASEGNRTIRTAENGADALAYLKREGLYKFAPLPDIVFLNLNLPKVGGIEVLRELKTNDKLKQIPVIVITNSDGEREVHETYDLYANCFITKPLEIEQFRSLVQSIENFWLNTAILPTPVSGR
jgi:CheY-like chemotaxis protein